MTQIIEITASADLVSPTGKAYADGSDTLSANASPVTEATNRDGLYSLTFTGLATGVYRVELADAAGVAAVRNVTIDAASGLWTEASDATLAKQEEILAAVDGIPTNAEFEARTLPSADYFVVGDFTEPPTAAANASQVRTELTTELARIDATISSRSTFAGGAVASVTDPVTVGTNNDKTGYALTQAFPANFASLGINTSGHVSRVVLVDTVTTNTDMRGTDSAATAANLALVSTEVGKIPRGASAIAAGGNATRTKVSADGTTLVEAIT